MPLLPRRAPRVPRFLLAAKGPLFPATGWLGTSEGQLRAAGTRYEAYFDSAGPRFLPLLGRDVPRDCPTTFTLRNIRRGDVTLATNDASTPYAGHSSVRYERRGGIQERYDVRDDGLHLSFLFPDPLGGDGDLVVRMDVLTDLTFGGATASGGVRFENGAEQGIEVGAVTGIDAAGKKAAGTVEWTGDALELTLPASFLEGASYPLVLDPVLGTARSPLGPLSNDRAPEIAGGVTPGDEERFLVVYERHFSAVHAEVWAQLLDGQGVQLGWGFPLSYVPNGKAIHPAVAFSHAPRAFLVAWEETGFAGDTSDIICMRVAPEDGLKSSKSVTLATPTDSSRPTISGERVDMSTEFLVAWEEGPGAIRMAQVSANAGAPFRIGGMPQVDTASALFFPRRPSFSKTGGDTTHHLLVWERATEANITQIWGQALSSELQLMGPALRLSTPGTTLSSTLPSCDGDGERFVVAWERKESQGSSFEDIVARSVRIDATGIHLESSILPIENDSGVSETLPAVAYTGSETLIGYVDDAYNAQNASVVSIDPQTCLDCRGQNLIQASFEKTVAMSAASNYATGGPMAFPQTIFAWEHYWAGIGDSDVLFRSYADTTGARTPLAPACGPDGGRISAPCSIAPNPNFTVQLQGGAPNSIVALVANIVEANVGCGPCTIIPSLGPGLAHRFAVSDEFGNASVQFSIPPHLAGTEVAAQWMMLTPGGPCPLLAGFQLSEAVRVRFDS